MLLCRVGYQNPHSTTFAHHVHPSDIHSKLLTQGPLLDFYPFPPATILLDWGLVLHQIFGNQV